MDRDQKLKNIYDLRYNHILNKQNVLLGFIGALMIGILFTNIFSNYISKLGLILSLVILALIILVYYGSKLEEIIRKIKDI